MTLRQIQNFIPMEQKCQHILRDSAYLPQDAIGFFRNQLANIESKIYSVEYKPLKGLTLFPVDEGGNIAAEYNIFNIMDYRGKAKVTIHNYNSSSPRVDVSQAQRISSIATIEDSYAYNINEIRAAQMAGMALEQARATAARNVIDITLNDVIWYGVEGVDLYGILTSPDVPKGSVPADGTGSSTKFVNKTPKQILRDLSAACNDISITTGGLYTCDNLILPVEIYEYLNTTPFASDFNGISILKTFQQTMPEVTVDKANELKGAGIGGEDVMLAYAKNMDNACISLPVAFEQFPPEYHNKEYVINCQARCGGLIVRKPMTINIKEGI